LWNSAKSSSACGAQMRVDPDQEEEAAGASFDLSQQRRPNALKSDHH
jgi:hypothetical protein